MLAATRACILKGTVSSNLWLLGFVSPSSSAPEHTSLQLEECNSAPCKTLMSTWGAQAQSGAGGLSQSGKAWIDSG